MYSHLEQYLNHHLSGSAGAVELIETLASCNGCAGDEWFFKNLKSTIEHERGLIHRLLSELNKSESKLLDVMGNLTAKSGCLKLHWEGMDQGDLGLLEALEVLSLGIEGKLSLWKLLGEISPSIPEWSENDFQALAREAQEQRNAVEARRIEAGRQALMPKNPVGPTPKTTKEP